MKNVKKLLGMRIRELRKFNKLTQEQLAESCNMEVPSLSNIENGKNYPNSDTIEKIANGLNVCVFELFIFEHLQEPNYTNMLDELINILQNNKILLRTIYNITNSLKKSV